MLDPLNILYYLVALQVVAVAVDVLARVVLSDLLLTPLQACGRK